MGISRGRYRLWVGDRPVVVVDSTAAVSGDQLAEPAVWLFNYWEHLGRYTIEAQDRSCGWVLPVGDGMTPIAVRTLIVVPSEPPVFPAYELWSISPLPDSEIEAQGLKPDAAVFRVHAVRGRTVGLSAPIGRGRAVVADADVPAVFAAEPVY
ncbi:MULTISPECIES: I66 family serine proteinase inhibitor [Kitasatospora]|uniref:I66 family serine proteinase inhibitor n=1 Tax=Kitasatospora TaxID=2063 RepID=UPI000C70B6A3|nr:I66 family serine proteinase inhibitor [Kitasatospora sp. GP30]MDH6142027.1 hypothetical protein [Kitasatospora sp. GP30]